MGGMGVEGRVRMRARERGREELGGMGEGGK